MLPSPSRPTGRRQGAASRFGPLCGLIPCISVRGLDSSVRPVHQSAPAVAEPLNKQRISLQLPDHEYVALRELAEQNHRSMAAEVRLALRARLMKELVDRDEREAA